MFPSRPPNVLFSARQQNLNNIGGINHQRFHRQTNNPGDPTVVSNFVDTGSVYGQHQQQQQQQPPWRRVPFPSPEQVCLESIVRFLRNYRETLFFLPVFLRQHRGCQRQRVQHRGEADAAGSAAATQLAAQQRQLQLPGLEIGTAP